MIGNELAAWRKRNGYVSQAALQEELGVKSRGTISAWENSDEPLPRTLALALAALERLPELRRVAGSRTSAAEAAAFRKTL